MADDKERKVETFTFNKVDQARVNAEVIYKELIQAQAKVGMLGLKLANEKRIKVDHSTDMKKIVSNQQEIVDATIAAESDVRFLKDEFDNAVGKIKEVQSGK